MKKISHEDYPRTIDPDIPDSILDLLGVPRTESKMHAGRAVISLGVVLALSLIHPVTSALMSPEALRRVRLFYKAGKKDISDGQKLMEKLKNLHAEDLDS